MEVTPELIERIAGMVTAALANTEAPADAPCVLAIGPGAAGVVPSGSRVAGIDAYQGSCAPFKAVVLTEVSCALLADMALGRDASKPACAVAHALLEGVPVYVLADGLAHRAYRASANPRFYAQLEGYVERIGQFGVRVADAPAVLAALESQLAPAPRGTAAPVAAAAAPAADIEGLLSAREAQDLIARGISSATVAPGAVVTPLARDVLREHGVELVYLGRA